MSGRSTDPPHSRPLRPTRLLTRHLRHALERERPTGTTPPSRQGSESFSCCASPKESRLARIIGLRRYWRTPHVGYSPVSEVFSYGLKSLSSRQRTPAILEWTERFVGGNRRAQLEVIPGILRLRRFFYFVEVHVMNVATVDAYHPLAVERIVSRNLLHLGDHSSAVSRTPQRLERLEVMKNNTVVSRRTHGRHQTFVERRITLREGAARVIAIPVIGGREDQSLRRRQPECMHIGDEHEEPGEALTARDDTELCRLLDRVDGIATGIGEADHLGLGGLSLEEKRREVRPREGRAHSPEHLAAILLDHCRGIAFECVTEGIVGGQEKPRVAARLDDCLAGPVGECPGIVGPVNGVRRALRSGQIRCGRAG